VIKCSNVANVAVFGAIECLQTKASRGIVKKSKGRQDLLDVKGMKIQREDIVCEDAVRVGSRKTPPPFLPDEVS